MSTGRRVWSAVLAASAVALAGWGSGDREAQMSSSPTALTSSTSSSPTVSDSASSSTTPTSSASVTVPEEAQANTEAGAIAFAKFYLAQTDRAREAGNPAGLRALSGENCSYCATVAKIIDADAAKGLRAREVRFDVDLAEVSDFQPGSASVRVLGVQEMVELVNAQGDVVRTQPEGRANIAFEITQVDGLWSLEEGEVR